MPHTLYPVNKKTKAPSFYELTNPLQEIHTAITPLVARGNRPLQMTFEDQLNALIYFHLAKPVLWIDTTNAIRTSISGRQKENTLSAASRLVRKRP